MKLESCRNIFIYNSRYSSKLELRNWMKTSLIKVLDTGADRNLSASIQYFSKEAFIIYKFYVLTVYGKNNVQLFRSCAKNQENHIF